MSTILILKLLKYLKNNGKSLTLTWAIPEKNKNNGLQKCQNNGHFCMAADAGSASN